MKKEGWLEHSASVYAQQELGIDAGANRDDNHQKTRK